MLVFFDPPEARAGNGNILGRSERAAGAMVINRPVGGQIRFAGAVLRLHISAQILVGLYRNRFPIRRRIADLPELMPGPEMRVGVGEQDPAQQGFLRGSRIPGGIEQQPVAGAEPERQGGAQRCVAKRRAAFYHWSPSGFSGSGMKGARICAQNPIG